MPYKDKDKQAEARKKYEEKRKKVNGARHKCWTLITYPDSMPDGWEDMLSEMHMHIWVSPLHNMDCWTVADEKKNPKHVTGTLKKPHYHVIIQYEVQVDRETLLQDFGFLNGPTNVKAVKSLVSMVRYLVHADDPKKAQYDKNDILVFGGAEIDVVEQLGSHERHEALREMRLFIKENQIVDFCEFYDYCDEFEVSWAHLLDDNSRYTIERYIKSLRGKLRNVQSMRQ